MHESKCKRGYFINEFLQCRFYIKMFEKGEFPFLKIRICWIYIHHRNTEKVRNKKTGVHSYSL